MTRKPPPVLGRHAPAPRPTLFAAFCVAVAVSVPVALILWGIEAVL